MAVVSGSVSAAWEQCQNPEPASTLGMQVSQLHACVLAAQQLTLAAFQNATCKSWSSVKRISLAMNSRLPQTSGLITHDTTWKVNT